MPSSCRYRWPAEWEPHRATWLSWPHNRQTWPGRLDAVTSVFVTIARLLHARERVCVCVGDERLEADARTRLRNGGVDLAQVEFHRIPTDDAWARDHGPIFLERERDGKRERLLADFRFDAWGGKYEPHVLDDAVPERIATALGLERLPVDLVLEGGSIDGNGRGTLLTTRSCLLHPSRGADRTPEQLEAVLAEVLGVRRVLWLDGCVAGDDTDGHVDDLARFVGPRTVVTVVEEDPADVNFASLARNRDRLRRMVDQDGRPLEVVTLPMPPPLRVDGVRVPASYANFYLANGVALVPTFGVASDERCLAILREVLPDRQVVGVPALDLVTGLGAIHCVTQQEPALAGV